MLKSTGLEDSHNVTEGQVARTDPLCSTTKHGN